MLHFNAFILLFACCLGMGHLTQATPAVGQTRFIRRLHSTPNRKTFNLYYSKVQKYVDS